MKLFTGNLSFPVIRTKLHKWSYYLNTEAVDINEENEFIDNKSKSEADCVNKLHRS